MTSRRSRQSRTGQKHTAKPDDLRTRGASGPVQVRVLVPISTPALVWPAAEDVLGLSAADLEQIVFQLDGRRISGPALVESYRFIFGEVNDGES